MQGQHGNVIDGPELRVGGCRRRACAAGRGDRVNLNLGELQAKLARNGFDLHLQIAEAVAARQVNFGGQDIKPQILLLQPAAAEPALIVAERFAHFAQRFAEGQLQMGRSVRRTPGALAEKMQVANVVAAKINNDAIAATQLALVKRGQGAHRLGAPAEERRGVGVGFDYRDRWVCLTTQRGPERLGDA